LLILFSSFSSSTFLDLFLSSPPSLFFKSNNTKTWMEYHPNTRAAFFWFFSCYFPQKPKLLKDSRELTIFAFLPKWLKNCDSYFLRNPKLKKSKYQSCQHEIASFEVIYHAYCFCLSRGIQKWKLFQETSIPFLKSLRGLITPHPRERTVISYLSL
jgi:hypothetical protein